MTIPWKSDSPNTHGSCHTKPYQLPRNYKIALQNFYAIEKHLSDDEELSKDFYNQIEDMIDRVAAVIYYNMALVGI